MPTHATRPDRPLDPLLQECRKVIVGQDQLLHRLLVALLVPGHVLLEGLPGLAKTRTVRTLAAASHLQFRRVQFTPDLLPSDVVGTQVFDPRTLSFSPRKGPVFANLLLADEINRAPSKVQSALLEAMEERQVTLGETSFPLPDPFLVLATQNPLEQEGTFPLPEAQMDRFLFKLRVDYPSAREETEILQRASGAEPDLRPVLDGAQLLAAGRQAREVRLDEAIRAYIVRLVQATRPGPGPAWKGRELLRCGPRPGPGWPCRGRPRPWPTWPGATTCCPTTWPPWPRTCSATGCCSASKARPTASPPMS